MPCINKEKHLFWFPLPQKNAKIKTLAWQAADVLLSGTTVAVK